MERCSKTLQGEVQHRNTQKTKNHQGHHERSECHRCRTEDLHRPEDHGERHRPRESPGHRRAPAERRLLTTHPIGQGGSSVLKQPNPTRQQCRVAFYYFVKKFFRFSPSLTSFAAEREGFEPSIPFRIYHLSRVAHSTALASLLTYKLFADYRLKPILLEAEKMVRYFLYSKISPGWHWSALQIASNVPNRIAFALPFFKTEMLAIVMPTLSVSSVTLILRFASMTSMLIMIAIPLEI